MKCKCCGHESNLSRNSNDEPSEYSQMIGTPPTPQPVNFLIIGVAVLAIVILVLPSMFVAICR